MDQSEALADFQNKFYGYANVIAVYSKLGQDLLAKIYQKKDTFNSLSENERLQFIKSDPDFVQLQSYTDKLEKAYVLYYNFIASNMQESGQKVAPPKEATSQSTE
jgi:hypothetical protein